MSLINITVGIVSTAVSSGLMAVRNQIQSFRKTINSEFAQVAGFGAIIAGVVGAVRKAISSASEMEGFKASFTTLLGSADAAEQRLKELVDFAKTTPFELPQVTEASRVLQALTDGALATGDGLRMVGDMASVAQEPIKDLAVHVGRMYTGLMGGRAVGESFMRLQELGLLSDKTRQRLEQLQAEGKKGPEVWQVAASSFAKFSGEMERKNQTIAGQWSNMQDALNALFRAFGQPIIDGLTPLISAWTDMFSEGASAATTLGNAVMFPVKCVQTFGAAVTTAFMLVAEEIDGAIAGFKNLGALVAATWESISSGGTSGSLSQAFDKADKEAAKILKDTAARQKNFKDAFKAEYDNIWNPKAKPQSVVAAVVPDLGVEESTKQKKLREEISKMQEQYKIDQLEGEAKINALIEQRRKVLEQANDETLDGLEATKEAFKLQQEIDKEKERYAKSLIKAQENEKDAQEKLDVSRMSDREKKEYTTNKMEDLRKQAAKAEADGDKVKAAELRTEALTLQQGLESDKPKSEVRADSLARIGGGGRTYLTGAEDLAKRTARASEDGVKQLILVRKELEDINRSDRNARWNP